MATSRREPAARAGDPHRPTERHGISPSPTTAAVAIHGSHRKPSPSSSRPPSIASSPDAKPVPNYLKPSSHGKPNATTKKTPAAMTSAAAPKRLTRIKSMEMPPPASGSHTTTRLQASSSLKERAAGVKSTSPSPRPAALARLGTDKAVKPQKPMKASPAGPPVKAKSVPNGVKRKEPPAAAAAASSAASSASTSPTASSTQDATEAMETSSEPDVRPAPDGEEQGGEEEHQSDAPTLPEEEGPHAEETSSDPTIETEQQGATEEKQQGEAVVEMEVVAEHAPQQKGADQWPPVLVKEARKSSPSPVRSKSLPPVKSTVDEELQRKLRARQAWEVEKKEAGEESPAVAAREEKVLKGEETMGSEDAASKLAAEKKVLALVGAFETVISLQEPETPQGGGGRGSRPSAGSGS